MYQLYGDPRTLYMLRADPTSGVPLANTSLTAALAATLCDPVPIRQDLVRDMLFSLRAWPPWRMAQMHTGHSLCT